MFKYIILGEERGKVGRIKEGEKEGEDKEINKEKAKRVEGGKQTEGKGVTLSLTLSTS